MTDQKGNVTVARLAVSVNLDVGINFQLPCLV